MIDSTNQQIDMLHSRAKEISARLGKISGGWNDVNIADWKTIKEIMEKEIPALQRQQNEAIINYDRQIQDLLASSKDVIVEAGWTIEDYIKKQKEVSKSWQDEVKKQVLGVKFGDIGTQLFDTLQETLGKIREVMISGIAPEQAQFLIQRYQEQAKQQMTKQYSDYMKETQDSYLQDVRSYQEEILSVVSEGLPENMTQKALTKQEKLAEIQRRAKLGLQNRGVEKSALELQNFGLQINNATSSLSALDLILNQLNSGIANIASFVSQGDFSDTAGVMIGNIFDPSIFANTIQNQFNKILQPLTNNYSIAGVGLV
jgi:hypothetical protein